MKKYYLLIISFLLTCFVSGYIGWNFGTKYQEKKCYEEYLSIFTFMGGDYDSYDDHTYWDLDDIVVWDNPEPPNMDSLMALWITKSLIEEPAIADEVYVNGKLIYKK